MKVELDLIEKLTQIITANGLTEITVEDGNEAITIRKEGATAATPIVIPSAQTVSVAAEEPVKKGKEIISPMVGTFYSSASPDSPPYVEVGSQVNAGDVVCVIEAMKLMNEIKSDYSGKITQICVNNGDPIEYGQVLMYIE